MSEYEDRTEADFWKDLEPSDVEEFEEHIVWLRIKTRLQAQIEDHAIAASIAARNLPFDLGTTRPEINGITTTFTAERFMAETVRREATTKAIEDMLNLPDIIKESLELEENKTEEQDDDGLE